MDTTIFYSWQSDNRSTRNYVEASLNSAVDHVAENPDIEVAARVDKDTQGASGAVHIVDTIKKKIKDCGIFLADVSLVDKTSSGRHLVNLNVMFELGYAMGVHSEARVILVANSDLGDVKNLPFDISHHRVITFSPTKDPKGTKLEAALQSAISIHLDALDKEKRQESLYNNKERLIKAIENDKPTRTLSNTYLKEIYSKYLAMAPARYKGSQNAEDYAKLTYEAYLGTKDITLELFEVLSTAAEYGKGEVLAVAYKSLESVSQYYDSMPGDSGSSYTISSEYYAFVVYEVIALILGLISRDKLWATLEEIGNIKHSRPDSYGGPGRTLESLYRWPEHSLEHYKRIRNANYYIPTSPLIESRFKEQDEVLQMYIDGSLLRLFMCDDYSWVAALLMGHNWEKWAPQFIKDFKNKDFIKVLKDITGHETLDELAAYIWGQATKRNGYTPYHQNMVHIFAHFGINGPDDIYTGTVQRIRV